MARCHRDAARCFRVELEASLSICELLDMLDFCVWLVESEMWELLPYNAAGIRSRYRARHPDISVADVEKRSVVPFTTAMKHLDGTRQHSSRREVIRHLQAGPPHIRHITDALLIHGADRLSKIGVLHFAGRMQVCYMSTAGSRYAIVPTRPALPSGWGKPAPESAGTL